jgi:hypothetical protein
MSKEDQRQKRERKTHESGRFGSTDTWTTVTNWLVGDLPRTRLGKSSEATTLNGVRKTDGEFAEVVTDHFWLQLDSVCSPHARLKSALATEGDGENALKILPL